MGTSFVEFKEHGYWTRDSFLEGLLFMLVREIKKLDPKEEWHQIVIEEWTQASTAGYSGCVPSCLDELFDTAHKIEILEDLLTKIINGLQTNPCFLTVEELNQNNVGGGGWISINVKFFARTGYLMHQLVNGKLEMKAGSPVTYWNDLEE